MPERLPAMDVAQVHLGHRQPDGRQRIGNAHRGVAVGAGVDHDASAVPAGGVDRVDQFPLVVALHRAHLQAALGGDRTHHVLDLLQRGGSVDLGLPGPQQVQVGPVDKQQTAFGHLRNLPTPHRAGDPGAQVPH